MKLCIYTERKKNIISIAELKTEFKTFNGNLSKNFVSFAMTASCESWVGMDSESRSSVLKTEITRNPSLWHKVFSIIENQVSSSYIINILAGILQRVHKTCNKMSFNKLMYTANPTGFLIIQKLKKSGLWVPKYFLG